MSSVTDGEKFAAAAATKRERELESSQRPNALRTLRRGVRSLHFGMRSPLVRAALWSLVGSCCSRLTLCYFRVSGSGHSQSFLGCACEWNM